MITVKNALHSIRPNAEWMLVGDQLEWADTEQTEPTQAEIDAEIIRLQAEWDATQYQRDRAAAYASIGDQLDMRYHDLQDGTTTWADHVAIVKEAYPK